MNHSWILYLLITFILSFSTTASIMPSLLKLCKRKGIYDLPNERKVHHNKTPRLGGILFMPSMLVGVAGAFVAMNLLKESEQMSVTLSTILIVIGMFLLYLIGMLDDLFGMRASIKFLIQITVSMFLPFCGLYIHNLYGLLGIYEIPVWIGYPLTVFVSLLIVNAINLIDGIDGLASSLSLIAISLFSVLYFHQQIVFNSLYCVGLAGSILAFLYFNLFGSPEKNTKTFMGDTGSLTLGYALAFLAIRFIMTSNTQDSTLPSPMTLVVPYTLLIIPCFDLVRVAVVRLIHHKPIFHPDKTHIHHKCLQAGFNMHQSLVIILALQLSYCVLNATLIKCNASISAIVALDIITFTIFNLWLNKRKKTNLPKL